MRNIMLCMIINTAILSSCNRNNITRIDNEETGRATNWPYLVDIVKSKKSPKIIPLSSIGHRLEYIPLETNERSLIKEIINLEFSSNFIFIHSSMKLLQFTKDGKFVRQVGANGRGPGEYNGIYAFCIDEKNEKVFILTKWPSKLLEYNYSGEFIESSDIPWSSTQMLLYDTIGLVFHIADDSNLTEHSGYNIYVTDYKGNILKKYKRHFVRKSNLLVNYVPFYYLKDTLHFKQYAVDTMYTLKHETFEPYAIFDLGKFKLDPNLKVIAHASEDWKAIVDNKNEDKKEIRNVLENTNYLFTSLFIGFTGSSKYCIFNKLTGETRILEKDGFLNDIDGGIVFWPKSVYNDSILIDYCNSAALLNTFRNSDLNDSRKKYGENFSQLERLESKIDEMSNPVIIILSSE